MTEMVATGPARHETLRRAVIAAAIILAASPYVVHVWSGSSGYFVGTLLLPADLGLAAVAVIWAQAMISGVRRRRVGSGALGMLAVSLALAIALMWHPSGRGVLVVVHFVGAALLGFAVGQSPGGRRGVAMVLCGLGVVETILALIQVAAGRSVGLSVAASSWIEVPFPLFRFGRELAPFGTFPHPYVLAGFSLVAAVVAAVVAVDPEEPRPFVWAVAGSVSLVPVGLTFSRTALIGVGLAGTCLLWATARSAARARSGAALLILMIGLGVPAALAVDGWRQRAVTTTSAGADTGRIAKSRQAIRLLSEQPVAGVGPGRYRVALERRFPSVRGDANADQAVHDLPLLAGAEGGVLALVAMTGALAWLGWRAVRAGPLTLAVYLALMPFVLLDQFLYESVQGVVILSVWLGVIDGLAARAQVTDAGAGR